MASLLTVNAAGLDTLGGGLSFGAGVGCGCGGAGVVGCGTVPGAGTDSVVEAGSWLGSKQPASVARDSANTSTE